MASVSCRQKLSDQLHDAVRCQIDSILLKVTAVHNFPKSCNENSNEKRPLWEGRLTGLEREDAEKKSKGVLVGFELAWKG